MNEIFVRTNRGEYSGGQTIYGAVYLRAVIPCNAEALVLSIFGAESCSWKKTVADFGNVEERVSYTPVQVEQIEEDEDQQEIKTKDITFEGRKELFQAEFNLATFEEGAVPLGCYAYPFHYTLRQGLPNSFVKSKQYDEIKETAYEASIRYQVTAKLFSSARSDTILSATQNIEVKNLDLTTNKYWSRTSQKQHGKYVKSVNAPVKSCCCFPRGELGLQVELERIQYTLGEAVKLRYCIDNRSDIRLEKANIKLRRTLTIHGHDTSVTESGNKQTMKQTGFPEILKQVEENINIEGSQRKTFDIHIPLSCPVEENLSGTIGSLVKCRYNVEVEVEVPWDADVSVNMPILVFPGHSEEWLQWIPPEWIDGLKISNVNGICAVAKHLLESKEFENVPLPNNTKL